MNRDMVLMDSEWRPASYIPFSYPKWITLIPIKLIRDRMKKWYWEHGGEE